MTPLVTILIATALAGHPTKIACDTDTNPGPVLPPPGFVVEAWTPYGGDTIHMAPALCAGLSGPLGSIRFAKSIRVLVHEAAHARGVRDEGCAELHATLGIFDVLRRFYRTPFFSRLSQLVGAQVLAESRLRPANYQPHAMSCEKG